MKNALLFLLLAIAFQGLAQDNPITAINISLPANPDANPANWGTGTSMFTITASTKAVNGKVSPNVIESKILVIIKKGGAKVCSDFNSNSAPAAGFNTLTKVWAGANAASLLGKGCVLVPGDYELCVQFFGYSLAKNSPISEEKCKSFTIRGNDQQAYQPPQAIVPADGASFTEADIKKPITFRWLPVLPRPQAPVTYHLSVWQLMQGQTGIQAMKSNLPIIEKDVDNMTQLIVTDLMLSSCKLPYLCSFIWNVQAFNKERKGVGNNDGKSGSNQFKLLSSDVNITGFQIVCVSYGVYSYTLTAENPGNGQFFTNSIGFISPGGAITLPTFSPVVPGTTISNGTPVSFTGTFHYNGTYPAAIYSKISGYQVGNTNLTSTDTAQDTLQACLCKDCDKALFNFAATSITPGSGNNGRFNLAGNISVSGLPSVYGIELQIQSYDYSPNPISCSNGVMNIENSGMFLIPGTTINGSALIQVFNETISGSPLTNNNAGKDIKYISTTPLGGNIPVNLLIGLPGPIAGIATDCCKIKYNVCISVKVYYDRSSCKSCLFTKCVQFSNQ